jgi:hypothetical protein
MVDLDHQMILITVRQSATTYALRRYVIDLRFCLYNFSANTLTAKKKSLYL